MFTEENTEGFSNDDLKLLNEALEKMISDGWHEKSAGDRINNNWMESGNTVESLTR